MNKIDLLSMVEQGMSTHQIAKNTGKGQTTIRHWLKKFGLKTKPLYKARKKQIVKNENGVEMKVCPQCKSQKELSKDNFYITSNGKAHGWCKKCNDEIAYKRQRELKQKCVDMKGGKCIFCGYSRYIGSMDFHHIEPNEKEYSISDLKTYSFEKIKVELDKCILVCRNCHGELHGGLINL
jgi:transposase-like protein